MPVKKTGRKGGSMNVIDMLENFGIYHEVSFDGKHCYKWQPIQQNVLIVSDKDQKKAAGDMFIELLKSIHYEVKYMSENPERAASWIENRLNRYLSWEDENVNKTLDLAFKQFNFTP